MNVTWVCLYVCLPKTSERLILRWWNFPQMFLTLLRYQIRRGFANGQICRRHDDVMWQVAKMIKFTKHRHIIYRWKGNWTLIQIHIRNKVWKCIPLEIWRLMGRVKSAVSFIWYWKGVKWRKGIKRWFKFTLETGSENVFLSRY